MMNIMKNIVRYMIPAAAFLAMCSCSKEEPVAMDRDDCYDVYFDGGQSKVYELDQSEEASVTFTVSRENIEGAIVVPLKIEASESGIFAMTSLQFEDGASHASFTVFFDSARIQKEYSAKISITDPRYARVYGLNDTSVEFSVIREDYQMYAYGMYHSELMQSSYSTWEQILEYSPLLDTYRFPSLFEDGYHVLFKWDGGLNVTMVEDSYSTGMSYQDQSGTSLGIISGDAVDASYDPETGLFSFTYDYVVEGYGGFGELTDQFMVLLSY